MADDDEGHWVVTTVPVKNGQFDLSGDWVMGWDRDAFRALKARPEFHALVTLARMGNVLRFVENIVDSSRTANDAAGRRQLMNVFFLSGAVLVEANETVRRLMKRRGMFGVHRTDLQSVVRSQSFRSVVRRFHNLRRTFVFHFDENAAAREIAGIDGDFVVFASGNGPLRSGIHYDLADVVAVALLDGLSAFDVEKVGDFLEASADAARALRRALDAYIEHEVSDYGVVARRIVHSESPRAT